MTHKELENIIPSLRPHLIRVGYDFFADMAKAEDVAQEVLMRLWLTADRIDPDIGITPLAVRMAKNYCVSEWRKQKHKPPVMQTEAMAAKAFQAALKGDWKAWELVRDTAGQKPVERVMVADVEASVIAEVEAMVNGSETGG